jgi:hypothetical protein
VTVDRLAEAIQRKPNTRIRNMPKTDVQRDKQRERVSLIVNRAYAWHDKVNGLMESGEITLSDLNHEERELYEATRYGDRINVVRKREGYQP